MKFKLTMGISSKSARKAKSSNELNKYASTKPQRNVLGRERCYTTAPMNNSTTITEIIINVIQPAITFTSTMPQP